jgi:hypothetical protein
VAAGAEAAGVSDAGAGASSFLLHAAKTSSAQSATMLTVAAKQVFRFMMSPFL